MKTIYLEPDEEITSVIEKVAQTSERTIAVIVPKNSALFQSLVNVRLLAKEAAKLSKQVALVSPDKVGARLAKQVGIASYPSTASLGQTNDSQQRLQAASIAGSLPDGTKINRYVPPTVNRSVDRDLPEAADQPRLQHSASVDQNSQSQITSKTEETEESPSPDNQSSVKADEEADLPPVISRTGAPVAKGLKQVIVERWKSVVAGLLLIVIGLIILAVFLPRATVTLTLTAKPINQTIILAAKTINDGEETTITGNLLVVERTASKTITATGKKDIGARATGIVTITNKYKDETGAGKDQIFAAGTTITETKTKLTFTLDKAVTVGRLTYNPNTGQPIYQSQSVGVTATAPGENYNLPASSFSLVGALPNTEIVSSAAFTGGLSKQVTILSPTDVESAIAELKSKTQTEGLEELKKKAGKQNFLEEAFWQEVKQQRVEAEVGSQVASADASLTSEISTIVFDQTAVDQKIRLALEKLLKPNEELLLPDNSKPNVVFKSARSDKSAIDLEVKLRGFAVPRIDKQALSRELKNRSLTQAERILKDRYQVQSSQIRLYPDWWLDRLPILPQAIKIEFNLHEVSGT